MGAKRRKLSEQSKHKWLTSRNAQEWWFYFFIYLFFVGGWENNYLRCFLVSQFYCKNNLNKKKFCLKVTRHLFLRTNVPWQKKFIMALHEQKKSCVEKYARRKYFGKMRNEIKCLSLYDGAGRWKKREGRKKCWRWGYNKWLVAQCF